jgi:tetratricopeptide (TPR) repeat protein
LSDGVALLLSAALFAAIGIPLLAVLLAWSWRRAAAVFLVYVGVWAAGALALIIVLYGWSMANWASTLVVAQVFLIALIAPQPFLLLLLTGYRRLRAVVPMTLAGSLLFCAALLGSFFLMPEMHRLRLLQPQVMLGHAGAFFISAGMLVLFVSASLFLCWRLLRLLASLYERKLYSDRQLLVDSWSLVLILYAFARLGETPGTPQLLIAIAFIVFFVYRLLIHVGLRLLIPGIERPPCRRLLLLRTFGFQRRTERLFDVIAQRWRFHGAVLMIAGTDLASRTINPADYLRFLGRRLRHHFIRTDVDLQRNLERLDDRPDPDGRYRVNELFCGDHAWNKALVELLDRADVVLMDLRGFAANNQGCIFELQQLVTRGPAGQVFLTVDDTTDRSLLDMTLHDASSHAPTGARKLGAADLIVLPMPKETPRAMAAVFTALQGAKLESAFTAGQHHQTKLKAARRRGKAAALTGATTALLLISSLGIMWRRDQPDTLERVRSRPVLAEWYNTTRAIMESAQKAIDADTHYKLGVDLQKQDNYRAAIAEFQKALALQPDLGQAHIRLGAIQYREGDYDGAIREFQEAAAVKPDLAEAHQDLGVILDQKRDYDAAIVEYRKALAVEPDLAVAHYNLGVDLEHKDDYEAAIAEYRKALAVEPDLADAHYNLGVILDQKGDYAAAIVEYRKALAVKPDLPDADYNLAVDLFRLGDAEAAVAEFQKALVVHPDLAEAHVYLGGIMLYKGDYDGAISENRKALAMKPDLAEAHFNLAVALYTRGRREEADQEFQEAHRLNPARQ